MWRTKDQFVSIGWALACAALGSCGSQSGGSPTYPTAGELYYRGKPAIGARVAFQPELANASDQWPLGYPRGVVDEAGKFVVETYAPGDGCPPGDYIVLVTWPASLPVEERSEESETIDRLQGRYATRDSSPLRAKVEAKPTVLERYELK